MFGKPTHLGSEVNMTSHEMNRRDALLLAAGSAAALASAAVLAQTSAAGSAPPEPLKTSDKPAGQDLSPQQADDDKSRIMQAGMTEQEAECWELCATLAGKLFDLPKLHVMDDHEIAHAIHAIQNRILCRPTYRKYLEIAKAAAGPRAADQDKPASP
jgi:hypothetical protein